MKDKPAEGDTEPGSHVLMAMSTQRRTMDFEKEFTALRDDIGRAAGGRSEAPEPAGTPH
ncbi:hypothetical protein D3C86_1877650 [compost metagenome]